MMESLLTFASGVLLGCAASYLIHRRTKRKWLRPRRVLTYVPPFMRRPRDEDDSDNHLEATSRRYMEPELSRSSSTRFCCHLEDGTIVTFGVAPMHSDDKESDP
jgi:hypothetical protein